MGEKENKPFQLTFNGFLKVDFQGSRVTSDGGLILIRELDERLGLGKLIDEHLTDSRQGTNKKFPFVDLVRQSVYSRLAKVKMEILVQRIWEYSNSEAPGQTNPQLVRQYSGCLGER